MPRNTPPSGASVNVGVGTLSEQAVSGVNDILDRRLAELGLDRERQYGQGGQAFDDVIMNPNGQKVSLSAILDHDYIAEDHHSIFADEPSTYLIAPNPDCMYVWAAKGDAKLFARIRSGAYRPVGTDELRDDTALPVTTHTVPGITHKVELPDGKVIEEPRRLVACYDVVLMEVQPRAVKQFYKWPAFQAALRTRGNVPFERFKKKVEQDSRGYATAELTIREEGR
jgi:hypothetical protein